MRFHYFHRSRDLKIAVRTYNRAACVVILFARHHTSAVLSDDECNDWENARISIGTWMCGTYVWSCYPTIAPTSSLSPFVWLSRRRSTNSITRTFHAGQLRIQRVRRFANAANAANFKRKCRFAKQCSFVRRIPFTCVSYIMNTLANEYESLPQRLLREKESAVQNAKSRLCNFCTRKSASRQTFSA